ncbi:MAG: type II toxin-antitoxin system HicA family toxin [Synergistaceae bacterium]|nr:type II toxin-antitoxin system HicA family toxin [Synergistaceae bacterium]MBQ2675337.1 type II toxin-antitoxin system HicA family toxin [Prevotella sp.]MBQ6148896.1 type II toxin-antitoxin system HicA family toxin [Oscillospiraceae bacterium]
MTRLDKAKARLLSLPRDYTYSEARYLLGRLGFEESTKGKTSGSRVKFYRPADGRIILLHRPHPTDIMSAGAVRGLAEYLRGLGEI